MNKKILVIFLILLSASWFAGCITSNPVSPEKNNTLTVDFLRHAHTIRSYTADITRTYAGNENDTDVVTINVKYPDKLREDFQSSPKYGGGTILVIRENQSFHYIPSVNQIVEMTIDTQDWSNGRSWAEDDYWKMAEVIAGDSDISVTSCETADKKTYCTIEMRPQNPEELVGKYRSSYAYSDILIEVDTATFNPLKMQLFYDNDTNSVSIDYRNLTINPDLSDSLFTIQFPAGVTVITPPTHPSISQYPDVEYPK